MAVELPPFRSLQDFITDARFSAPTINDLERLTNRTVNNLLYYQTNYFFCAIVLFLLVATLHPKDLFIGASVFVVAIIAYIQMKRSQTGHGVQSQKPLPSVAVLAIAFLLMYLLGSIFVFIWGVTLPIAVVLLHAATRMRNVRNKLTNVAEMFKEDTTPMSLILGTLCSVEENEHPLRMQ